MFVPRGQMIDFKAIDRALLWAGEECLSPNRVKKMIMGAVPRSKLEISANDKKTGRSTSYMERM